MSEPVDRQLALARHYLAIDQHARVLEALDRADETALGSAEYWLLRASALHELDRHQDAVAATDRGLAVEPEAVGLLRVRSEALARQDRLAEAERAILGALRQDPEDPALLCSYARLVARDDQLDKAERLLGKAARVAPDSPAVIGTRLLLAHLRGNDRGAASHAHQLLSEAPDQAGSHYLAGFSMTHAGDVDRAARHFRSAAELEPGDHDLAEAARESRFASHPLLMPIRLIARVTPAGLWLGVLVTLGVLTVLRAYRPVIIVVVGYLALCVYSWVVPPLLRRRLRRRRP